MDFKVCVFIYNHNYNCVTENHYWYFILNSTNYSMLYEHPAKET